MRCRGQVGTKIQKDNNLLEKEFGRCIFFLKGTVVGILSDPPFKWGHANGTF